MDDLRHREWTTFQIEAEEAHYGVERLVKAHNELRAAAAGVLWKLNRRVVKDGYPSNTRDPDGCEWAQVSCVDATVRALQLALTGLDSRQPLNVPRG